MPSRQKKTTTFKISRTSFISTGVLVAVVVFLIVSDAPHFFAREFDNPTLALGAILFFLSLLVAYSFSFSKENTIIENTLLVIGLSLAMTYISLVLIMQLTFIIHGIF